MILLSSWVVDLSDRLVESRPDRAEVESIRNARRSKADLDVLVVAEGLVLRLAAPAKGRPGQNLDHTVLTPDLDLSGHHERPIPHGRDRGRALMYFLRSAIQPPVEQRATRAKTDDVGDFAGCRCSRQDPRSPVEVENVRVPA